MAAQDYEQVTYNSPAGAQVGSSTTEKVAFHGSTPCTQVLGSLTTTTLATLTTTQLGSLTTTEVAAYNTVFTNLNSLITALKTKGL